MLPHLAAQSVDLAHDLTLGDTADGRIARHRRKLGHVHGQQQRARPETCGSRRSLTAGVSAADNYYVVMESHSSEWYRAR